MKWTSCICQLLYLLPLGLRIDGQHEQGPKTRRPITGNLYGVGTELWGGGGR